VFGGSTLGNFCGSATWCWVVHDDWFWLVTQQKCCVRVGGSDSSYFLGDVLFGGRR